MGVLVAFGLDFLVAVGRDLTVLGLATRVLLSLAVVEAVDLEALAARVEVGFKAVEVLGTAALNVVAVDSAAPVAASVEAVKAVEFGIAGLNVVAVDFETSPAEVGVKAAEVAVGALVDRAVVLFTSDAVPGTHIVWVSLGTCPAGHTIHPAVLSSIESAPHSLVHCIAPLALLLSTNPFAHRQSVVNFPVLVFLTRTAF